MANYFLNDDGSLSKKAKKKKGNNYILQDDGKITLNSIEKEEEKEDIAPVKKRTWFNGASFNDGYDFGDVTKTILGTAGDIGTNLIKGSAQAGEGLAKLVVGGVAEVSDWVGQDKYADKLRNRLAGKDEEFNKRQEKFFVSSNLNKVSDAIDPYSVTGEKLDDLTSSVGTMVAAGSAPIPWWVTMGGSSAGHELENAYKSGATSGEAWGSALISGASEVLLEKLSGGISFGGRTLDEGAKRLLSKAITNKTASTLAKFGLDMVGEGAEEVLTEVASNIGRKLTYEDEKTWGEVLASEEALDGYLEAFIGGAVMGGGFNTIKLNNSFKTGRDYDTGLTQNEQRVVEKEIENRIAQEEANGKKLTKKQKTQIEEQVKNDLGKGYIDIDTIESTLGGETYNQLKTTKDNKTSIENQIKELENKKAAEITVAEKEQLEALREELKSIDTNTLETQLQSEMDSKIASDDFLKASYQERTKKGVKFNADLSKYDAKQQKVVQKAIDSGILNDTNKTHDFIDMVAKISAEKGIDFDFANNQKLKDSGFALEGKTINGFINENGITLNMDSNKALNKVVGHEITHILEGTELYTELQNAIMEYDITKKEYGTRYNELKKLYKGVKDADIKKELTADLVGDYIFNDPDFVNNLSTTKPNVFQKIYNEIKYLLKVATAGSKEARQLEKVKKTFEEAYRNNTTQTNVGTKYSIVGERGLDYNEGVIEGYTRKNLEKAQQLEEEGKTPKEILKETGWYKGIEGKWKFEIDDSNWSIKEELKENSSYTLGDVLEAPELYKIYPGYKHRQLVFGDLGGPEASFNRETQVLEVDNKYINDTEGLKSVLSHELQHTTQTFEWFASGSSPYSWLDEKKSYDRQFKKINDELESLYNEIGFRDFDYDLTFNQLFQEKITMEEYEQKRKEFIDNTFWGKEITELEQKRDKLIQNNKWAIREIGDLYKNTAGEIEARQVQERLNMSPEERKNNVPFIGDENTVFNPIGGGINNTVKYSLSSIKSVDEQLYDKYSEKVDNGYNVVEEYKKKYEEATNTEEFKNAISRIVKEGITLDSEIYKNEIAPIFEKSDKIKEALDYWQEQLEKDKAKLNEVAERLDAQEEVNKPQRTPQQIVKDAEKHFGVTDNFKETAYIDTNGKQIDFSGKHEGGPSGTRTLDHRQINEIDIDMDSFIGMGNIRILPEGGGINLAVEPNAKQYSKLRDYIDSVNDEIYIDVDKADGTYDSATYKKGTSPSKIINDLKIYFETGSFPKQSELAQFRYSLSKEGKQVAPSRNDTFGSDIKLQVEEAIAPLKEDIAKLQESLQTTTQQDETNLTTEADSNTENTEYAALTEADLPMIEQQNEEAFRNIDESNIPIEIKENINPEEEITPTKSLFETRNYEDVGNRKVKAYQYENPEVKPYFQEVAQSMLDDLNMSTKGQRTVDANVLYETNGEAGVWGTTRDTAPDIAELLDGVDGKYKLSYEDIRKGLEAIIQDHGAENIASSKRIEFYLDQRLRNGYTTLDGYEIPANQEYLKTIEQVDFDNYFNNIPIDESLLPPEVETMKSPMTKNTEITNQITSIENEIEAPVQRKFDLENETITDKDVSDLEKKQQREYKKLGTKEDYISNKAFELYNEVKGLKKGVKASYELGRVLDVGFANINALTEGMSETQAKEYKNKIWRDITTALLNVKAKPSNTVNKNSTIEAVIRQNLNREYDSKKNDIANMKEEDLVTKTKKELRKELLIDENDFFINALDNAKNRSMALMNNTDTIRNTELVFGRENAKVINEKIFQKEIDNEADSIAWQNQERQEIKDLGIKARSKESAAVQKYGEKQYLNEFEELVPYGDKELASEFPDVATQERIKNAAKVIRSKYDNYIDRANEVLTRLGFDPIPKRNDYMRHFQELNDVFSRYGIPFNAQNMSEHVLPTDINGLTENWSPQKNYFANMQARKGLKTTYDAITGVDGYIGGIANLIYHTEDIQRGRAFEELIRETYGENKGWDNLENLPEELQQARMEKIQDNHLSNYAAWVHEWTNNVAGKKHKMDRSIENAFGRKFFTILDTAKKQVGSNMIGFNLSSSLTNLIAPVQAIAKTNKLAVAKGTADTIKNIFIKDDFMSKNKFLTSRMGTDMLSKNAWQKVQDAGYVFMKGMDWFSSNQIVRSKYYELRAKGMNEQQAHVEAGQFAARIMGDRTKGANPQYYNSKMLGLLTQFQLEVNNQLYSIFYDTYHESKENAKNNAMKTAAGMTFTLGQLFAFTHVFGKTFESIAGYNPTFDVIGILATAFGVGDDEDEEKPFNERLTDAANQLVDSIPYINIAFGGGRIPVTSGIPNLYGLATGGKDEYGNELKLKDELEKLPLLIFPTGSNQLKKTTQGLGMFDEDLPVKGSYTDSGNLRYPVEDTPLNRVQAALFGQYANKNAGDYFDNERQPLKEKQIQEYADLDIPIADYWKYREGLKEQDTIQEKFDYINSLDVSDEQKNIMINNAVSRKEQIDLSGYDNFNSYEEFDYATKNPDKYNVISQIDSFDNYNRYKEDISSIKEQFSNENGYSTAERKRAVQEYINSLNLDVPQKLMLEKMAGGYSIKSYENYMYQYIESLNMSAEEKQKLHNQLFN